MPCGLAESRTRRGYAVGLQAHAANLVHAEVGRAVALVGDLDVACVHERALRQRIRVADFPLLRAGVVTLANLADLRVVRRRAQPSCAWPYIAYNCPGPRFHVTLAPQKLREMSPPVATSYWSRSNTPPILATPKFHEAATVKPWSCRRQLVIWLVSGLTWPATRNGGRAGAGLIRPEVVVDFVRDASLERAVVVQAVQRQQIRMATLLGQRGAAGVPLATMPEVIACGPLVGSPPAVAVPIWTLPVKPPMFGES